VAEKILNEEEFQKVKKANTQTDYDKLFEVYRKKNLTTTGKTQNEILNLLKHHKRIALTKVLITVKTYPTLSAKYDELVELGAVVLWRTPQFLENRFKRLIESGNLAITNKNYDRLREVNWGLISLLPKSAQQEAKTGKFGI
jgi:MoaA/NifB/PqqE/SkfB family radical SAM enzyme